MIFEAKKDKFFSTIFYGVILLLGAVSVIAIKSVNEKNEWIGIVITILTLLFLVWVWYGTEYKIENNVLRIVSGPIKKNIPIRTIKKVEMGKTLWVGYKFGLSKGGVIIQYNEYDEVYISPEDNEKFCKALKRIHSDIEIAKNID